MTKMIERYKKELELAGLFGKDSDYGGMLGEAVLELCETLEKQGHSGCSVMMTVNIFSRLIKESIISPLTGNADEWVEIAEEDGKPLYQNNRRSSVFKRGDEPAYDIDGGPVFRDIEGNTYTCRDSVLRDITFPYSPKKREVVDDYVLRKKERLAAAAKYQESNPITYNTEDEQFKWSLVNQELWMWSNLATWEGTITKTEFDHLCSIRGFDAIHVDYLKGALAYMDIRIV